MLYLRVIKVVCTGRPSCLQVYCLRFNELGTIVKSLAIKLRRDIIASTVNKHACVHTYTSFVLMSKTRLTGMSSLELLHAD